MQDLSWKMLIQLRHLLSLGIQRLRIHRFSFGRKIYRKVQTFRERMNRLLEMKNQYPY